MKSGFSVGGILKDCIGQELKYKISAPSNFVSLDEERMAHALKVSMRSVGLCNPNPAVGAVIFKNNQLVAEGHTQSYGGQHAERVAIEKALARGVDLRGAELYVTLEPCAHQGKQPPCADLVAGVPWSRVVVGTGDPNPLVKGKGFQKIRDSSITRNTELIESSTLSEEIRSWNFPFFGSQTLGRPVVIAKWAQSQDGFLAPTDGKRLWISGEISRSYSHWLRQKYDVNVVGIGTLLKDLPKLTVRDCVEPIQCQPLALVFDPNAKMSQVHDPGQNILDTLKRGFIFLVKDENEKNMKDFLNQYQLGEICHVITCSSIELDALQEKDVIKSLSQIRGRPITSYFVEGGVQTLSNLFEKEMVDLAHVFISSMTLKPSPYELRSSPLNKNNEPKPGWKVMTDCSFEGIENFQDQLLELTPQD
jgi:diaminohydroxyphosphoribosylaminopyrimidine deaminase/5-amino-6-(5-phosphoribosylamino)uracil reductase